MSPTTDADADTARPTVGHWTHDDCDIYIGRGYDGESNADLDDGLEIGDRGWLGNPFEVGDDGSRDTVVAKFAYGFHAKLQTDPEFRAAVRDLAGDTLGCWCQRAHEDDGDRCHGEVIADAVVALTQ